MTTIQIAFPVLRGRRRFHVEKGRRWSLVEHLMLDAVARKPTSAAELSEQSKLPRRIVVEAFIRLMRVGWVEIVGSSEAGPIFDVTASGREQAGVNELPAATFNQPRWMGFIIDQVAGSVFRGRELSVRHPKALSKSPGSSALVFLDRSDRHFEDDLAEIFAAMEGDDEVIVNVDDDPGKFTERYAVVTVTDGVLEGLPARASPTLRDAILAKAKAAADAAADAAAAPRRRTKHRKRPRCCCKLGDPASPLFLTRAISFWTAQPTAQLLSWLCDRRANK